MPQKGPGRHYRKGLTTREIYKMFPDKEAAEKWFESIVWQDGRFARIAALWIPSNASRANPCGTCQRL